MIEANPQTNGLLPNVNDENADEVADALVVPPLPLPLSATRVWLLLDEELVPVVGFAPKPI
jgi:hypothetical protein